MRLNCLLEVKDEGGAFAQGGLYIDAPTVKPHDASHCREAQARSTLGCCKEGIEDSREIFFAYPTTIIGDFNKCFSSGVFVTLLISTPDAHDDLTLVFDRLDSIDN